MSSIDLPMPKILFVITKSNWGGAQRYVFDLATALPKGWQIAVAMGGTGLPGAAGGRLETELRHKDIRTLFVSSFRRDISLRAEWRVLRELWDLFAREQPDIVHLNSSKAGGLGALAARLAGVPHIVFTLHGAPWQEDRSAVARAGIFLSSWITFLLCHRVITISNDAYKRVRSFPFCKRKTLLIHNGLAPLDFVSKEEARDTLISSAPAGAWIGAVGELTWNKSYHSLLRAAGTLKRRQAAQERSQDFFLCIVGEGEERKFLETVAQEENIAERVHFAGFIPEAHRLLKAFDLFVLPSMKEGLPYVLLEAGQAGVAVVATKVGGVPDIIENRATGLLSAPKDSDALADRLEEILDDRDLRQKYAAALHTRVQKEFSLETMLERTLKAYKN